MKYLVILFALLVTLSCSSQPALTSSAIATKVQNCQSLVGVEWTRSEPPILASELLAMASFAWSPDDTLWYTKAPGHYIACAYNNRPATCEYSTHEFRQLPEQGGISWSYLSGSVKTKSCAAQSSAVPDNSFKPKPLRGSAQPRR